MTDLLPWSEYESWHVLIDALCIDQNHHENAQLASELCSLTGTSGEAAFETAQRNLANWRSGQHLPHRKNFGALSKLLNIDRYDGLKPRWNELYTAAKKKDSQEEAGGDDDIRDSGYGVLIGRAQPSPSKVVTLVLILAIVGLAAGYGFSSGAIQNLTGFGKPEQTDVGRIRHQFYVKLKIGESAIIHGARSKCGTQPAPFDKILPRLPKLKTGTFSDGGIGSRYSRSCNGLTPARALKFTATHKGHEEFMLFGDRTTIEVE